MVSLFNDMLLILTGVKQTIHQDGCAPRDVWVNACLGACRSFSVPLMLFSQGEFSGRLFYAGGSKCCSIKSTHDVSIYIT